MLLYSRPFDFKINKVPENKKKAVHSKAIPVARYKIRFHDDVSMDAAIAFDGVGVRKIVVNKKRKFISVAYVHGSSMMDPSLRMFEKEFGAEIIIDFQYQLDGFFQDMIMSDVNDEKKCDADLNEVMRHIKADQVWPYSRGEGIFIAVVDTGINGHRPEFQKSRQSGGWAVLDDNPWTDWHGHGTMCACIAAGSSDDHGVFNGVAPRSNLISCKTHFYDSELASIYDYLIEERRSGKIIVATNSFGISSGKPPVLDDANDFPLALQEAIMEGIHVFFSAGNNHLLAGGGNTDCSPNSIWLYKSRNDLMVTATCKLNHDMWHYSSRGPGQFFGQPNANNKPDVTAPTPENGLVIYGDDQKIMSLGWGTSGACPQTAGLAVLLLAKKPQLDRNRLFQIICSSATNLGYEHNCQGSGMIDCMEAYNRL